MDSKTLRDKNFVEPPQSYWIASTSDTSYPSLEEDIKVDVVIVGGDMVGITTGFLLKKEGLTVAILEADRIVKGTTAYTTAKITSQHSLIYHKIKTQMGLEKAQQYAEANESAIHFIAKLIEEEEIDCDFSWRPAYVYTQKDNYVQKIINEVKTASSLGIKASFFEDIPLPIKVKGAMRFDNQAQFHPRKYMLFLANKIPGNGSNIFENSRVVDVEEGSTIKVIVDNGKKVIANSLIVASHYPFYDIRGLYFTRLYQERSYVVVAKVKEKFPEGMFINAEEPTRSLRSLPYGNEELVMFIGDHHKTGHGEDMNQHYDALIDFAKDTFTLEDILYRWSTQDCMTLDSIPYVGHHTTLSRNIFVATGFCKWGMTNSTASAMILRDLIIKGDSPWAPVYNPSRSLNFSSAGKLISINAEVAEKLVKGKLSPLPQDINIEKGEGRAVNINGRRTGAYRDEDGALHLVDTTCTHLGCELAWNEAERSWDCPCHGSRFTYDGEIIEGPTTSPLRRVKIDE